MENENGIPILQKDEPIYKWMLRCEKVLLESHIQKRNKILKFINTWFHYKYAEKEYFEKIWYFKNIYYYKMPNDNKSKEFLKKYFEEYNEYFKLDLEYDEKLFTTYNVLYMIKLMLKTINGDLKKEIEEKNIDDKMIKNKKYSVKVK
jgi:hypothetical protein